MSPEDKDEMRAKALLHYTESLQEVAMLRNKITESGDFFIEVGKYLQTDPFMYLAKQYVFAPQAELNTLVKNWHEAVQHTEMLRQKAISYGASL